MPNATISFGVASTTTNFSADLVVTEENLQRVFAYLLGGTPHGTIMQEDGTEVSATPEQAAQGFADETLQGLLSSTVGYERSEAARAAVRGVASLEAVVPGAPGRDSGVAIG